MNTKKRWWQYTIDDILLNRRWNKWKKMALKAISDSRTESCVICGGHIVPGDFVCMGRIPNSAEPGKEHPIHGGFHFSLNEPNAFCETGALICGWWDGEKVVYFEGLREPIESKAIQT